MYGPGQVIIFGGKICPDPRPAATNPDGKRADSTSSMVRHLASSRSPLSRSPLSPTPISRSPLSRSPLSRSPLSRSPLSHLPRPTLCPLTGHLRLHHPHMARPPRNPPREPAPPRRPHRLLPRHLLPRPPTRPRTLGALGVDCPGAAVHGRRGWVRDLHGSPYLPLATWHALSIPPLATWHALSISPLATWLPPPVAPTLSPTSLVTSLGDTWQVRA